MNDYKRASWAPDDYIGGTPINPALKKKVSEMAMEQASAPEVVVMDDLSFEKELAQRKLRQMMGLPVEGSPDEEKTRLLMEMMEKNGQY
jgi:hypothetical protein